MPIEPDARVTPEMARFINACEALEPADTGDLYPYVRQRGYHGSRRDNIALGYPNDYSIRSAADRRGPDDKAAAFDWISESARLHGDHTVMNRYSRRVRSAYNTRDARLAGWREWLTWCDGALIGFDFADWYTRVPDPSHGMHHHGSIQREFVGHWPTYAGMLSILAAEPLTVWQAGGSRYLEDDVTPEQNDHLVANAWRTYALLQGWTDLPPGAGPTAAGDQFPMVARLNKLCGDVEELKARPAGTLVLTSADKAELIAGFGAAAEQAVRRVLGAVDGATPS